jgi:hypothetical protein
MLTSIHSLRTEEIHTVVCSSFFYYKVGIL